ncbi:GNAT family N-acetyltransferase [Alteromonas sp. H39]|uniref:GNAT family N-acetyltransferase n=1 Tax=Alteromonas sp. H39 TaxID=3389876 RepID=UPI0039E10FC9
MTVTIGRDNLTDAGVAQLLNQHLADMRKYSPAESIHAITPEQLRHPSLSFWSARSDIKVVGCGALKHYSDDSGEVKSMKTDPGYIRQGIAGSILTMIIDEARKRNYASISLETGTHEAFHPAIALYKRFGFDECGPFGDYRLDPYSCFFRLAL